MTEIRKELEHLIALNYAEQWVPNHIAFQQLLERANLTTKSGSLNSFIVFRTAECRRSPKNSQPAARLSESGSSSASKAYSKWTGNWINAVAICVAMLKDDNETNRAMGAECLLSIRRQVQDHLDLLTMAMADCSWQARIDIEELLAELRRQ